MCTLLITGCAPPAFDDLQVTPLPGMPTVLEVSWLDAGGEAHVDFGQDLSRRAPSRGVVDGRQVVWVAGHPELTDVPLRPGLTEAGTEWSGPELTGTTGLLSVPNVEAITEGELRDGALVLAAGTSTATFVVFDRQGRTLLSHPNPEGMLTIDAQPALDGRGVWVLQQPVEGQPDPPAALKHIDLDGQVIEQLDLPDAHHTFQQLNGGDLMWLETVAVTDEQGDVHGGERVMRGRPGQEPQEVTTVWQLLPRYWAVLGAHGPHGNGLSVDESSGLGLVSFRALSTVVEFDLSTGEPLQVFGQMARPESAFEADTLPFEAQHAPSRTPEGDLLLFDNGDGERPTRVVQYQQTGPTLREVWSHPSPSRVEVLGDAWRMQSGGTFISWGMRGQLQQLDADDALLWQADMPIGTALGDAHLLDDLHTMQAID